MKALARIGRNKPIQRRRTSLEISFLPAALEIVERPPSPIGRAISLSIIALFALALIWSCLARVDLVASAQGEVVPSGRSKVVQPLEVGVVKEIFVHDGQRVTAGELLIRLDSTSVHADQGRIKADLTMAELDVVRLSAVLQGKLDFDPPINATPAQLEEQRAFLASQRAETSSRLLSLDRQKSQKEAEAGVIEQTLLKIKAVIEPLQQRVDMRRYLADKQIGSKLTYLQEYQDLVSQQEELIVQKKRLVEISAAISALEESRAQVAAEYRSKTFADLSVARQKVSELDQELKKQNEKARLLDLRAPVDGVVEQLAIHTLGGVVRPAENLMLVVPSDSVLEIEAMLPNREVGFVHTGQPAAIKIDTFDFSQYGLLEGRVMSVSADAVTREVADRGRTDSGGLAGSSEPHGRELNYAIRIALDSSAFKTNTSRLSLAAGMAATVEIKTGSRRVISYLLSPIQKRRQESLHER